MTGAEGDDILLGDAGNDGMSGGTGQDRLYGGDDNDTMSGDDGDDRLYGGSGADSMLGGQGEDSLEGGTGNDTLEGGTGVDRLYGGDDDDLLHVYYGGTADGGTGGHDYDTLSLGGLIPPGGYYEIQNQTNDPDGDSTSGDVVFRNSSGGEVGRIHFNEIEKIVICFTPGTLIATPKGEVPVESLREGDKVVTRDNGIQEIRWTGHRDMGWQDFAAHPHLRPVLIRQGSLGNGLPERDMMVSPNHRMLVANDRTALYFDEHEVLVSAKHLVGGKGIQTVDAVSTTYIHFLFDRHEVVLSNGAWAESFQPGDYSLKGLGNSQRNEIYDLFPELKTEVGIEGYAAARKVLKKHEALLIAR